MKFFESSGISKTILAVLFIVKIILGNILGYIYQYYYQTGGDTFVFLQDGSIMYQALFTHPAHYFQMLFCINSSADYLQPYYNNMSLWHDKYNDLFNDNHVFIRLNALIRIFSFGYYKVHIVFICFLSMLGLTAIYKTFIPYLENKKKELLVAVFLVPSVLFWSSGVTKEGLLFFGLGLFMYFFHKLIYEKFSFAAILGTFLTLLLLVFLKVYVLIALLPSLLAISWIAKTGNKLVGIKYLTVYVVCLLLGISISFVFPNYNPMKMIANTQREFTDMTRGGTYLISSRYYVYIAPENKNDIIPIGNNQYKIKQGSNYVYWKNYIPEDTLRATNSKDTSTYTIYSQSVKAGSSIEMKLLSPDLVSSIKHIPSAFITVFVRPHLFEANSILSLCAAIENLIILVLFLACLFFLPRILKQGISHPEMFLFCLSFVFFLFILIGLTASVMGAMVRYKTPALPFLIIALLILCDRGFAKTLS